MDDEYHISNINLQRDHKESLMTELLKIWVFFLSTKNVNFKPDISEEYLGLAL